MTGGYKADPAEVTAAVAEVIAHIAASSPGGPLKSYAALTAEAAYYQAVCERLTDIRAAVVAQMNTDGMSYAGIAEMTGLSRARVQQLAEKGRALAAAGDYDLLLRREH